MRQAAQSPGSPTEALRSIPAALGTGRPQNGTSDADLT